MGVETVPAQCLQSRRRLRRCLVGERAGGIAAGGVEARTARYLPTSGYSVSGNPGDHRCRRGGRFHPAMRHGGVQELPRAPVAGADEWQDACRRCHACSMATANCLPEAIAVCPGIYQRYIEKRHDVRVTFIGDRLFAMSLGKGAGRCVCRLATAKSKDPAFRAEAIFLPAGVEAKSCARSCANSASCSGCIDLAVDKQGGFPFPRGESGRPVPLRRGLAARVPGVAKHDGLACLRARRCPHRCVGACLDGEAFWQSDTYADLARASAYEDQPAGTFPVHARIGDAAACGYPNVKE